MIYLALDRLADVHFWKQTSWTIWQDDAGHCFAMILPYQEVMIMLWGSGGFACAETSMREML